MMARAQASFNAELLIGSMVIVGAIGYLLNILFHWLERKVTHA